VGKKWLAKNKTAALSSPQNALFYGDYLRCFLAGDRKKSAPLRSRKKSDKAKDLWVI
jgi:hypothetical protein